MFNKGDLFQNNAYQVEKKLGQGAFGIVYQIKKINSENESKVEE